MTTKHTPGPWRIVPDSGDAAGISERCQAGIDWPDGDARDHYLATVVSGDPDELEANARLIASAPDMLAALRDVAARLAEGGRLYADDEEAGIVRAAIAKAEGA